MKILTIESKQHAFKLLRPYKITNKLIDTVENCLVKIKFDNGIEGLGAGAPIDFVTSETIQTCMAALASQKISGLLGQSIYSLPALTKYIQIAFKDTPAAAAAIDMALYDAYGKLAGLPLVDILGREHTKLPTSITIGIMEVEEAIREAKEYIGRGFKILKIKLGEDLCHDLELLHRLQEQIPLSIKMRVDMNQGYSLKAFHTFVEKTAELKLELIEQPLSKAKIEELASLPPSIRDSIAMDESLMRVEEGFRLVSPHKLGGIFNIKLMKCGGITPALKIADLASYTEVDLMWGCMDESIISITAALHAAFASTKTKYLDLDGSFDLADDLVRGGFLLQDGYLQTNNKPGLGLESLME